MHSSLWASVSLFRTWVRTRIVLVTTSWILKNAAFRLLDTPITYTLDTNQNNDLLKSSTLVSNCDSASYSDDCSLEAANTFKNGAQ